MRDRCARSMLAARCLLIFMIYKYMHTHSQDTHTHTHTNSETLNRFETEKEKKRQGSRSHLKRSNINNKAWKPHSDICSEDELFSPLVPSFSLIQPILSLHTAHSGSCVDRQTNKKEISIVWSIEKTEWKKMRGNNNLAKIHNGNEMKKKKRRWIRFRLWILASN